MTGKLTKAGDTRPGEQGSGQGLEGAEEDLSLTAIISVVDDDPAVTDSLVVLLEALGRRVETYNSAEDFLAKYDPDCHGCILLDERMPGMSGHELQEELIRRRVLSPVILITGHAGVQMAVDAMRLGAVTLLEKPFGELELLDAIAEALKRDAEARERHRDRHLLRARIAELTPRQREVMELVIRGMANKSVAHELGISERTVELHRARMLSSMDARSAAELAYAVGRLRGGE